MNLKKIYKIRNAFFLFQWSLPYKNYILKINKKENIENKNKKVKLWSLLCLKKRVISRRYQCGILHLRCCLLWSMTFLSNEKEWLRGIGHLSRLELGRMCSKFKIWIWKDMLALNLPRKTPSFFFFLILFYHAKKYTLKSKYWQEWWRRNVWFPFHQCYDDCSFYQVKILIGFWCRRDLNSCPLLDDKRFYQLS